MKQSASSVISCRNASLDNLSNGKVFPLQQQNRVAQTLGELRQARHSAGDKKFYIYRRSRCQMNEGENHFDILSDEILLHIFKWLPKKTLISCGEVSKKFYRVSKDETLWARLDLSGRTLQASALPHILSRGVIILRMAQTEVLPSVPTYFNTDYDDFVVKLQFLDLSMCIVEKDTLHMLLKCCRNLQKLSLENVPLNGPICQEIAANRGLEALNLTMCEGIDDHCIATMMKSLQNLQSLNIAWAYLSLSGVSHVVHSVSPNVSRLNMAGCRHTMTDESLKVLVKRCTLLRELDLSDCTQLSTQAINIVCKLKKLEYLSLSRCYNINITEYLQLTKIKSLKFLDVFGLMSEQATAMLETSFSDVGINKFIHSAVARPTVGTRRTSIWGLRTRD